MARLAQLLGKVFVFIVERMVHAHLAELVQLVGGACYRGDLAFGVREGYLRGDLV